MALAATAISESDAADIAAVIRATLARGNACAPVTAHACSGTLVPASIARVTIGRVPGISAPFPPFSSC